MRTTTFKVLGCSLVLALVAGNQLQPAEGGDVSLRILDDENVGVTDKPDGLPGKGGNDEDPDEEIIDEDDEDDEDDDDEDDDDEDDEDDDGETCASLVNSLSQLLESNGECELLRKNLTDQANAEAFCEGKPKKEGKRGKGSCHHRYSRALDDLFRAGCDSVPLFGELREQLIGVCDKDSELYCYPQYQEWSGRNVIEEITDLIESGNRTEADAIVEKLCGSKCALKIAKEYSTINGTDPMGDLSLLCKTKGKRKDDDDDDDDDDDNGDGKDKGKGGKGGFCFTNVVAALNLESITERAEMLCGDRCFGRVAQSIAQNKGTSEDTRKRLLTETKLLCLNKPEDSDSNGSVDDGQATPQPRRCAEKVEDAERELKDICSGALGANATCSAECTKRIDRIVTKQVGCCLSSIAEYRNQTLPQDEVEDFRALWDNLLSCASENVQVPPSCALKGRYKRRKALFLCGIPPGWIERPENTNAVRHDIIRNLGVSDENVDGVTITKGRHTCKGKGLTFRPTTSPTAAPSTSPTKAPTQSPTTAAPTTSPSTSPSASPSKSPSVSPSASPTETDAPTLSPSTSPTQSQTIGPADPARRLLEDADFSGSFEVSFDVSLQDQETTDSVVSEVEGSEFGFDLTNTMEKLAEDYPSIVNTDFLSVTVEEPSANGVDEAGNASANTAAIGAILILALAINVL